VDAGPNIVLVFPAKDLTLFGHATDPENDPLTVKWTLASGPAAVSFSAPWALATTVTFTTSGTYTFQLAVSDGTANVTNNVTVTVNPASVQTAFYVDPTYTGMTQNGSAANPWKTASGINWTAINSALTSNDVIIYFSARTAGSDVSEIMSGQLWINRTDKSTHRLTVDGMSKYNTNDTTPNWIDYTGSNKFHIATTGGSMGIGWDDQVKRDYITIRGFEISGKGSRVVWGGSYSYLESMWVHDVSGVGATVIFAAAVSDYPTCQDLGKSHAITVRNVRIERGIGEGIYIAGNYTRQAYGGCPSYGNTHSDILIEGNTIIDPGINGEQGDGIDLKAGLQNVTVRNNVIQDTHTGADDDGGSGIVDDGTFSSAPTNYLIEGNRFYRTAGNGMMLGNLHSAVIRNNVIANSGGNGLEGSGIKLSGDTGFTNDNVQIYSNTIYGNLEAAIDLYYVTGPIKLRNNLIVGNGRAGSTDNAGNVSGDYNLWAPRSASYDTGTHSIVQPSTSGIMVNPTGGDFHLLSTSPAIDKGVDLSLLSNLAKQTTSFAIDLDKGIRPEGTAWEIGAFELGNQRQLAPPQNLHVVK
jgi:hypothetical protein